MRFGAVLPTTSIGTDVGALREFVQGVESLGFHHIVAYDHVLGADHSDRWPKLAGPYNQFDEFHEPIALFAWIAAMTERVLLFPAVIVAPQRQTALLAKQACELQNLSQGRLRLGVGVGWNWVEFEALNCNFEDRGKVIEEQVELMQLLWTKDLVTYRGRYHTIDRAAIAPRPTSPIPIWFGGYTSRSLKRSFQLGVGHIFGHFNDEILALARQIRQLENGNVRGQFPLQMEAIFDYSRPPETWAASVTEWQKVGGTDLSIRTMATRNVEPSGCTTVKDHLDAFECWRNHLVAEGLW